MKSWAEVRREGQILERTDLEDETGVISHFFVKCEEIYYYCKMLNGETIIFNKIEPHLSNK